LYQNIYLYQNTYLSAYYLVSISSLYWWHSNYFL